MAAVPAPARVGAFARLPDSRYLLLYAAIGWLGGDWLGVATAVPLTGCLIAAMLTLLLARLAWPRPVTRVLLVLLLGACLGAARAVESRVTPAAVPPPGVRVQLRGTVVAEPDLRARSANLIVALEQQRLQGQWVETHGKVLVQTTLIQSADYGDRLLLTGTLALPPILGDRNYRGYLARQGIGAVMRFPALRVIETGAGNPAVATITAVRQQIESEAGALLPEPQASLLRAVLVGTRSATFADLAPDFIATGMIHIVATSGFKVNIVASALLAICTPLLGRRRAVIPCLLGVAAYVLLTGATPAGMRAGLMWAATFSAVAAGRRGASGQALALAAATLAAADPAILLDAGFQLSAMATAGLLVFGPAIEPWLSPLPRWAAEPVGATVAAQLATTPILLTGFHQLSIVSPVANLLCLPALPAAMALGSLAELVGSVSAWAATPFAALAWLPLTWMITVVHALASLPFAARPAASQGLLFTTAYYALLVALFALFPERAVRDPDATKRARPGGLAAARWWPYALCAVPMTLAVSTAVGAVPRDSLLHLTVLDVGQGDATLITDPTGQHILINAGAAPETISVALGEQLPPWTHELDLLVLTSYDSDEMQGAIEVVRRYRPRAALVPPGGGSGALYEQWLARSAASGVDVQAVRGPLAVALGNGARLELRPVSPPGRAVRTHARLLARLVYRDDTALLGGNLDPPAQRTLVESGAPLASTVLIVPHNGTAGSLDRRFLRAVGPRIAIVSASSAAKTGPPAADTLAMLASTRIFRTDRQGTIALMSDGHGWGVRKP